MTIGSHLSWRHSLSIPKRNRHNFCQQGLLLNIVIRDLIIRCKKWGVKKWVRNVGWLVSSSKDRRLMRQLQWPKSCGFIGWLAAHKVWVKWHSHGPALAWYNAPSPAIIYRSITTRAAETATDRMGRDRWAVHKQVSPWFMASNVLGLMRVNIGGVLLPSNRQQPSAIYHLLTYLTVLTL